MNQATGKERVVRKGGVEGYFVSLTFCRLKTNQLGIISVSVPEVAERLHSGFVKGVEVQPIDCADVLLPAVDFPEVPATSVIDF